MCRNRKGSFGSFRTFEDLFGSMRTFPIVYALLGHCWLFEKYVLGRLIPFCIVQDRVGSFGIV